MKPAVAAIIPAAGRGIRLNSPKPKAFVSLENEPLVLHSLKALQASGCIRWVAIAAPSKDKRLMNELVRRAGLSNFCKVVSGGSSRAESVMMGLKAVPKSARWVLIHDAARPCISPEVIERAVLEAKKCGAVACGLPSSVTVKAVDESDYVRLTLDRKSIWLVQTPQVVRRDWLEDAVSKIDGSFLDLPDDVSILEWAGYPVRMIMGDPLNLKVTTREDLLLAEAILKSRAKKKF